MKARRRMLLPVAMLAAALSMMVFASRGHRSAARQTGLTEREVPEPLSSVRWVKMPASGPSPVHSVAEKASGRPRVGSLFAEWAREAPSEAAEFALGLDDDMRREALLGVMRVWGERDAARALGWAAAAVFPDAREREVAMSMACTSAAHRDPRAAVELALRHGLDDFENGVLEALVAQWAEVDLLAVSVWVEAREPGAGRDALVESVALTIADADPAEAMRWALARGKAGSARERLVAALAERVVVRNPTLAKEWIESLLAGPARERAAGRIARPRGAG